MSRHTYEYIFAHFNFCVTLVFETNRSRKVLILVRVILRGIRPECWNKRIMIGRFLINLLKNILILLFSQLVEKFVILYRLNGCGIEEVAAEYISANGQLDRSRCGWFRWGRRGYKDETCGPRWISNLVTFLSSANIFCTYGDFSIRRRNFRY